MMDFSPPSALFFLRNHQHSYKNDLMKSTAWWIDDDDEGRDHGPLSRRSWQARVAKAHPSTNWDSGDVTPWHTSFRCRVPDVTPPATSGGNNLTSMLLAHVDCWSHGLATKVFQIVSSACIGYNVRLQMHGTDIPEQSCM
jgi:hypothetical protein